jgi:molybdopterin-containing oxidoreductase family membrane subunit
MATVSLKPKSLNLSSGFLAWLAFIGLCLVIGLVAAFQVFTHGLVITNMSDLVPWGLWITIDLSSIALGAGAFTLSAVVYIFGFKKFRSLVRLAVFVGFIGYTSALLTLVMDIGRPDRFWHPWVYWNVHSVLWEITWCITIYLTIMLVEFAPVLFESRLFDRWPFLREVAKVTHKLAPALAILGLLVSLLHQSSLGATYGIVKSRPIWFKPSMPIMFILSAVAVGPALTMSIAFIIEWLTGKRSVPHDILSMISRFSGLGLLVYAYIKFWDLAAITYYGRTPAVSEALGMLREHTPYNFGFWVGEIIIGILIPVLLFLLPSLNKKPTNLVLGTACAVLGVIVNRWNITVSGLFVPVAYSPGTLYQLPPGQYFPSIAEWAIGIGIIGYMMLMLTLGIRYLPLFPKHEES